MDSINKQYGLTDIEPLFKNKASTSLSVWYILDFPLNAPIESLIEIFQNLFEVELATSSFPAIPECPPNDSLFLSMSHPSNQWFHRAIETPSDDVWNCGEGVVGDTSILVAIIDQEGFAYTHPDLGNVWENTETVWFRNYLEEPLDSTSYRNGNQMIGNGEDDDENGYIDDYLGWDYRIAPSDPPDNNVWMYPDAEYPGRWLQHGLRLAGVIGALTNNTIGVSGIVGGWGGTNPRKGCKIMPVIATNSHQTAQAIDYCVMTAWENNITHVVINMSFAFDVTTMPIEVAAIIDYWRGEEENIDVHVLFVASAGNNSVDADSTHFPSDYPTVICVAAVDSFHMKSNVSNYGSTVDISAPGERLRTTTYPDGGNNPFFLNYYFGAMNTGTSFAAAVVSGVAALVWSAHPELTNDQLRERIESGAANLPESETLRNEMSSGLVNATNAVTGRIIWSIDDSPVIITDSMHIQNGRELVIDAGVHVLFDQSAALVVDPGAKLTVNGTSADSVYFDHRDANETWNGIYINGSRLDLKYATFYNVGTRVIYTNAPAGSSIPVDINHCCFDGYHIATGGSVFFLWHSPELIQKVHNTVVGNVPSTGGSGMYLYNCNVDFDSVTIENCGYVNSYIKKVEGTFDACSFKGRTSLYAVLTNEATCIPKFKCCRFENLAPASGSFPSSVFCGNGTQPYFGGKGYFNGVSNVTNDSSAYLLIMQGSVLTLPVIDFEREGAEEVDGGRNDWKQRKAQGKFIQWQSRTWGTYLCTEQFWSPSASISMFDPQGCFNYSPVSPDSFGLCGGDENHSGGSIYKPGKIVKSSQRGRGLDENSDLELFIQAMQYENQEAYAQAQDLFHNVVTSTQDARLRWLSATHIITTDVHLGLNNIWIPSLIDSLIQAENNTYDSRVYGKRLLANHYLNKTDYSRAIDICTALLNSSLTYSDSIWVVTELIGMQMAAGLIENGGGLDEVVVSNIPMSLRVTSLAQGLKLEQDILSSMKNEIESEPQQVEVPSKYELYQNYPNPFNPNTEIKFDLPENIHVELAIFNTLGQKVTTLINEERVAGEYRVIWDSKNSGGMNVASGVYIYQIKAGNFIQSRKMVLIR